MAQSTAASKERCDALSEVLADNWWAVGLRGVLGILFGLICLFTPGVAVAVFVLMFSAYMLVDGAFAIAAGIKAARNGERWACSFSKASSILPPVSSPSCGRGSRLWR